MTLPKADAPLPTSSLSDKAPEGACDSHIHMLASADEAPLWSGRVEDPAQDMTFARYMAAYRAQMKALGVSRTVVVQSILYGTDNTITARAVAELGKDARGIGLVTDAATDADLDLLVAQRLVGVRLNYVHGGVLSWDGVKAMAPRLAERGLHVQMLLNTHKHMADLEGDIRAMPVPVVIDHIGWPDVAAGPSQDGFQALMRLVGDGKAYVKLSAPYRLCPAPYTETDAHVSALMAINPERCLWGSDWPHIMLADAGRPDSADLLTALRRCCPSQAVERQVLVDTPAALYGF